MTAPWTSTRGVVIGDLVDPDRRRAWVAGGLCPDRDVHALFAEHARHHPERDAVIDARGTVDYATLAADVRRIAARLRASGCGERDIVAIALPNDRRAVAAELAVAAIGAAALPYPCGRGTRDSLNLLRRSRATAVVTAATLGDIPLAANIAALRPELADLAEILVFGEAPAGCRSLEAPLAPPAGEPEDALKIEPEAPARILVSSGSESEPKMVAYSHNAMAGGRGNWVAALSDAPAPLRALVLVPLSSSFGSLGTFVALARHGGTLILLDSFDPGAALAAIGAHRPTHVFGVPTMLRRMAERSPASGEDLSSLEAVVSSGAPLDERTVDVCRRRFGRTAINIYGSSDGVNCHTGPDPDRAPRGSAGHPDPASCDIRIVDEDGDVLPRGREGEIQALGPMTPLCYVNAPDLDARHRAPGGWVRTGDRGLLDDDGALHVVGRMGQVISRGGYKISPAEVEGQLAAHPAIAEACCVPVPGGDLGERVCACVAFVPGARLTLAEVTAFLEDERGLERRKLPETLLTLDALPLNPAGKVCRKTLARLATEELAVVAT